jgi:hypothetical protein
MSQSTVTRQTILTALREALEPLDYIHAMWEGGAAAFNRIDEWSDIDLQVDADDGRVADVVEVVERALLSLAPIALKYDFPQPTWHGHWQTFYHLSNTNPFLLLDFVVIKHSNQLKFLQPEIHGNVRVHFDKSQVVRTPPLDREAFVAKIKARLETLRVTFPLFQTLILKELNRHNDIEALSFYHGFTLRPLVEVLRMKYNPIHYDFYSRYLYYELPIDVVRKLEPLFFVADRDDLRCKRDDAERLFTETIATVDLANIAGQLG